MDDLIEETLIVVGSVVFAVLCVGAVIGVGNAITFPGDRARIEQLRRDALRVGTSESEDVMGQVTAMNQEIAEYQAYNRIPFICLTIPNGWDKLAPIELPQR